MNPILLLVTVLRLINKRSPASAEDLSGEGTLVKIKKESKYYESSPKDTGTVIGLDTKVPGYVIVSFAPNQERQKEYKGRYRIGLSDIENGACDLELDKAEIAEFAIISIGGQQMEIPINGLKVSPGDTLKLERETFKVIGVEQAVPSGNLVFIMQLIGNDFAIVETQGGQRTVSTGKFSGELEINSRVVLDSSLSVVLKNFGLDDDSFAVGDENTAVEWDDICGQEDAKKALQQSIDGLVKYPEHYAHFKKKSVHGILLFGPPGCGKTIFGKAVYTSIVKTANIHGIDPSQGFLLINGPELLQKYVGIGEGLIRHIFARARSFKKKYGVPAIIFIDECEAILAKRDSGISSDVLKTMVPTFLVEMQGVRESGAQVILATNKPELLDYAVVREGRMDKKIFIGRPDKAAAKQIFMRNMSGVPISGSTLEELADIVADRLFSPELVIYEIKLKGKKEAMNFTLADIINGAMVPTLVEEAKGIALERELKNEKPLGGITAKDLEDSVESIFQQNRTFDHTEALQEFTKDFADQIIEVKKLKQIKT
ncbi:MAG: AAA family ATPase [Candidatus Paceibacterota bacterium]|jgi:proteasome-associated ATPase